MAAGTSSRFAPLSYEKPKGLLKVKGEILIERQIRQLQEAGIADITVVVGYMAELFDYLKDKFGVKIVLNEDYNRYNNTSSLIRVIDELGDTFLCSSDNYFPDNVFLEKPECSYYSALYADGETDEYCLTVDEEDHIVGVTVGGSDSWYMVGHVFFNKDFSAKFREIMKKEYDRGETRLAVDADGDTASVVGDADDVARLNHDVDLGAVARQRLVDGVVDDLIDQMVQAARSR